MASSPRRSAAPAAPTSKKLRIDWDAVERDYRTGRFTNRELAVKHEVSHTAISKRAKDGEWVQDLSDHIRQATNAKLTQALVSSEVSSEFRKVSTAIDLAAEVNAQIVSKHRAGLCRITAIKDKLLDQIEQAVVLMPELAEVIDMVRSEDERGADKANDALRKAMARSGLVDDLKKLSEIDERVRKGEREAFNIESSQQEDAPGARQKRVLLEFVDVVAK